VKLPREPRTVSALGFLFLIDVSFFTCAKSVSPHHDLTAAEQLIQGEEKQRICFIVNRLA
jgi:hypothetical protein